VIDPENLRLVEHLRDPVVDGARARQVAADRFFDDEPRERLGGVAARDQARRGNALDCRDEERRGNGQVVDAVAGNAALVLDDVETRAKRGERLGVVQRALDEEQRARERLPALVVRRENSLMPSRAAAR
jgi:hypothetical protein